VTVAQLELDLEVFSGPFDLLLTLVLREEVDLLEVDLADVVVGYLDHLEARGELDLEVATEFLVLVAALLELKSRLLLGREEDDELAGMEPGEAAEELLARMLEARRYRRAADHLAARLAAEEGHRFRAAPLPPALRRTVLDEIAPGAYDPARLGVAIGGLLREPPPLELGHMAMPRVSVGERLAHLRALLRGGACSFDDAVRGADRVTVAVTLFALLELYKQGEATWAQEVPFGDIAITPVRMAAGEAAAS
jgi:segregation and condensation protein A